MKTYQIHLIRHGTTQGNLDGLYIGHSDPPLCEQGLAEIEQLKKELVYPEADFVFSSPLSRCTETARLIYPDKNPITVEELIEYDFGEFDGKSAEELHKKQPLFDPWLRGDPGVRPPFGESNLEFAERVCGCFRKIIDGILKTGTESTAVVTHGGVIMTLMANYALPEAEASEWLTPAGCGYTLRLTPSLWTAGQKLEAIEEIPVSPNSGKDYYDGWDYYPDDDDFDISEYLD